MDPATAQQPQTGRTIVVLADVWVIKICYPVLALRHQGRRASGTGCSISPQIHTDAHTRTRTHAVACSTSSPGGTQFDKTRTETAEASLAAMLLPQPSLLPVRQQQKGTGKHAAARGASAGCFVAACSLHFAAACMLTPGPEEGPPSILPLYAPLLALYSPRELGACRQAIAAAVEPCTEGVQSQGRAE